LAALVLQGLDEHLRQPLVEALAVDELALVFQKLPSDEAVDILNELDDLLVKQLLEKIPDLRQASNLKDLMSYPENTAGGLMNSEFIKIYKEMTVEDALGFLRVKAERKSTNFYYLYVVDHQDYLVGVIGLRTLLTSPPYFIVEQIMATDVIALNHMEDQEGLAEKMTKYQLIALPVVDDTRKLKGIVTLDDASYAQKEELTEDYYISSGLSTEDFFHEELIGANFITAVRSRTPWLFVTLIGSLMAVSVGHFFENTIAHVPLIAIFLPLLGGLGGNVGTQSAAMVVRGLATGQLTLDETLTYLLNQLVTGLIIGAMFGTVVGSIVFIWHRNYWFGLTIMAGLFANMTIGATLGTLVPLAFKRFGLDPAIASGPFITTAVDITGLVIYFGFATLALSHLT
jgi:magnesium transporter